MGGTAGSTSNAPATFRPSRPQIFDSNPLLIPEKACKQQASGDFGDIK
jgi:hypothetical protein